MQKRKVDIKRRQKCHSMRSTGTFFCECGGNSNHLAVEQNEEVQKHSICGAQQISNQHMLPSCQPQEGDGVAKVNAKRERYNVVQHCRLATMSDVSDSKRDTKKGRQHNNSTQFCSISSIPEKDASRRTHSAERLAGTHTRCKMTRTYLRRFLCGNQSRRFDYKMGTT